MAKKSSAPAQKAKVAPEPSASIDDIFASKPKPVSTNAIASSSKSTEPPKKKKKASKGIPAFIPDEIPSVVSEEEPKTKKSKKSKSTKDTAVAKTQEAPKRVVEEVVDPSIPRPSAPVVHDTAPLGKSGKIEKRREKRKEATEGEEDDMFADSRGTGPSECSSCS